MADITLSTGREIEFDLSKMSLREYRGLFDIKITPEKEDEIIAKVAGIEVEDYRNLPLPDYKRILKALIKKAREPLADPS